MIQIDINKPKKCDDCPCFCPEYEEVLYACCNITGDEITYDIMHTTIPDNCPIKENVSGKWLNYCYQNNACSICGYVICDYDIDEFNFCPSCGTNMKHK